MIAGASGHSAEYMADRTGCFAFKGQIFKCRVDCVSEKGFLRHDTSEKQMLMHFDSIDNDYGAENHLKEPRSDLVSHLRP